MVSFLMQSWLEVNQAFRNKSDSNKPKALAEKIMKIIKKQNYIKKEIHR